MNTQQPKELQIISTTQRLDETPNKNRGCETPSPRPIKKGINTNHLLNVNQYFSIKPVSLRFFNVQKFIMLLLYKNI
jgi:hypothetical protein